MSDRFEVKIKGGKALQKRIAAAARRAPKKLDALLAEAAFRVDEEAKSSIQTGAKTGRTYKRRSVTHQASAPGQAPATDTGRLVSSISAMREAFLKYTVGSRERESPHGFWLEFGTSKMAARPWLTPAAEKVNRWLRGALRKLVVHGR